MKKNNDLISHNEKSHQISSIHLSNIPINTNVIKNEKSLIEDIFSINNNIIEREKEASYVISSIYCLSHIPEFTYYFLGDNIKKESSSELLYLFKKAIYRVLEKSENGKIYKPKTIINYLEFAYKTIFDFKQEKEPIIFIEKIFEYINEELNNKDKEISNLNKKSIIYENNPYFMNYYTNIFIKRYNSIVSKVFYGIFQIKYLCESCGESTQYEDFKYINLNTTKFSLYIKVNDLDLNNSLVYYYLDDLIEFYFNDKTNNNKCEKCKKQNKLIEKKIVRFPDVLIFRIQWKEFNNEKGFMSEENWLDSNKLIFEDLEIMDLSKFAVKKNNNIIKYKLNNVINYGVINEKNKYEKAWQKFIAFCRHLKYGDFYVYHPMGMLSEMHSFNRKRFIPSVLFYTKL